MHHAHVLQVMSIHLNELEWASAAKLGSRNGETLHA